MKQIQIKMSDFTLSIVSKLPSSETSIFAVMSKLAFEEKAINLSQGYPDFPSSPELIELVYKAMKDGFNQYAPMPGIFSLRDRIAEKIEKLHGASYHPESEITLTAGATQAIFTIITALINPGDEVILFGPSYDSYEPTVKINGGTTVEVELTPPKFDIDWRKVSKAINEKTKMIIINTPHNPTGGVLSKHDMEQLIEVTRDTDIIILSDEVYEHIIFDGEQHQSISRFPELAERSFVVASFGKTFHNTGWKMGYCAAPKALMKEFQKVHQFNVFSVNHPIQRGLASYLKNEETYLSLSQFFQRKRDLFLDAIQNSRFDFKPSKGTYFQLLSYREISSEKDTDLAVRLTREKKIASIPISVFFQNRADHKMLRFCFAKSDETLLKGAEILNSL